MQDIIGAKILYWLVKKLQEQHYSTTVGKIVKLMYIYELFTGIDLDYELYHNGLYSRRVIYFIHIGKHLKWLEDYYKKDEGLFLKALNVKKAININKKDKEIIQDIIDYYGYFSTNELFVITTALYLKTKFGMSNEQVIDHISSLRPKRSIDWIKSLVLKGVVV